VVTSAAAAWQIDAPPLRAAHRDAMSRSDQRAKQNEMKENKQKDSVCLQGRNGGSELGESGHGEGAGGVVRGR